MLTLLSAATAEASRRLYLAEHELICDSGRIACIDGTLTYDTNSRVLTLSGRLQAATGPGMFQVTVRGTNRLGHVHYAPMEIDLNGNATEIVDFEMIPDHPDVENWQIDHIEFVPAPASLSSPGDTGRLPR